MPPTPITYTVGARRLHRDESVLDLRLAVLVVPVGDEHDHVPPIVARHEPRRFDQTVEDRGASTGRDRLHGARDRVAIAGRPGDRCQRLRKRRHDDAIVRPEEVGQPAGGPPNELHPVVHALARVHEQRVGDRQRFDAGEVDRLRLVVLEHAERGGVEAADEPIGLVRHGRFEQDSRGAGGLDESRTARARWHPTRCCRAHRSRRRGCGSARTGWRPSTRRHTADLPGHRQPACRSRRT